MTADGREATESTARESIRPRRAILPADAHFAVQRNSRGLDGSCGSSWGLDGSMAVRAHFFGDSALLQAALRQPGVGALDRAVDMI